MDIEVEAENEDEAISKAVDEVNIGHLTEWESCAQIVKGNVFYGHTNAAEVEEVIP